MKKLKQYFLILIASFSLLACTQISSKETESDENLNFVESIELAHHANSWYTEELIEFDLELYFGGKERFNGRVYMTPGGGKVRMEGKEEVLMIFDGDKAFISPDSLSLKKARFDLLTWSYFFAAPYKLSDPGTNIEELGRNVLGDNSYNSARLTFDQGVGDSPEDWYVLYQDTATNYLVGMAYIVTYSQSKEEAEQDPHLITYESFVNIGPYPIATNWNFWTWNMEGEMDKLLGTATISNLKFSPSNSGLFLIPSES